MALCVIGLAKKYYEYIQAADQRDYNLLIPRHNRSVRNDQNHYDTFKILPTIEEGNESETDTDLTDSSGDLEQGLLLQHACR
ncbi:MAG: hypothetical protein AAF153_03405 [Pseudomonadota bacterium]